MTSITSLRALLVLASASVVLGYGPFGGGYGPGDPFSGGGSGGDSGSSGNGGSDNPFGGAGNGGGGFPGGDSALSRFLGFDVSRATYIRTIHGILGAVAFVGIFPFGAVILRLLPGRLAVWVHALAQMCGYLVMIGAVALGIYMSRLVIIDGTSLFQISTVNFHLIIGLVVFTALILQPLIGFIHHRRYKKLRRRQTWSYLHLLIGRVFITLGIINGGLGLWIANAGQPYKIAYAVGAAVSWLVWMLFALSRELRHDRTPPKSEKVAPRNRRQRQLPRPRPRSIDSE